MNVVAARFSHATGSPDAFEGRGLGSWQEARRSRLVRNSRWPEFTQRRIELNLSQRGIASAMTKLGTRTSRQLVHRWENEGWQPSEDRIPKLAWVLHVSEQAVLVMFALDFGPEDRAGYDESDRLPVADRGGR